MAQAGENVGCRMLNEFVDDASRVHGLRQPLEERSKDECLKEVVRRIASEMAVPQFHLTEVIEKVLAVVAPQIEERVRKELQEVIARQEQRDHDSFPARP